MRPSLKRLVTVVALAASVLLRPVPASAAVAFVQSATGVFNGTVTGTVTFASPIGAGHAIGLYICFTGETATISTIAMTGETFTKIGAGPTTHNTGGPGNGSAQWAYALNTAGGQTVITVTLSGAEYGIVMAREISGVATASAADQSTIAGQTAPTTGTDLVTSGSVTPTQASEYLFGASAEFTFQGVTFTEGTGWTPRESINDNGVVGKGEELVQGAAAAKAATFTQDNAAGGFLTGILTFKAAATSTGSKMLLLGVGGQ